MDSLQKNNFLKKDNLKVKSYLNTINSLSKDYKNSKNIDSTIKSLILNNQNIDKIMLEVLKKLKIVKIVEDQIEFDQKQIDECKFEFSLGNSLFWILQLLTHYLCPNLYV